MTRLAETLLIAAAVAGCASNPPIPGAPEVTPNTLTTEERAQGYRLLFDGTTLNGWRGFRRPAPLGWEVQDGTIYSGGQAGVDLLTVEQFQDFELRLDWKIAPGGNSGIFYRGTEEYPEIYWSAAEMQVLDDAAHPDNHDRLTSAGSAYALYPAPAGVVRPAGEWNATRIIVRGHHVEHWMNGVKIVEYEIDSPEWIAKVAATKFRSWPNFGKAPRGHIGVQVHGNSVWYRSVRIRTY